jgi:hypothetical protein
MKNDRSIPGWIHHRGCTEERIFHEAGAEVFRMAS